MCNHGYKQIIFEHVVLKTLQPKKINNLKTS